MAQFNRFAILAALAALPLGACGNQEKDTSLAALDAQLTNNAVDPALKGALADQIVVDPNLVGQSNKNAVRAADKPANAALPLTGGDADAAQAQAMQIAGGKLIAAPAPGQSSAMTSDLTLGALAREQAQRGGGGKGKVNCTKQLAYGMQWAERMPEPFTLYPGAELTEAAGADQNGCTLRAASFVTPVTRQQVVDFYYTQAKRAGFAAEHLLMGGDNVLGGTRGSDGNAYFIVVADAQGGKTSVDIIADGGR